MQLILKPAADSRLREIVVTNDLFAIGRNEPHFAEYDPEVVRRLSRRHARIFERDGRIYIADLGSSNGTTVNDAAVTGEPVLLRLGDEVQFGGLRYCVEHLDESGTTLTQSQSAPDARVVLTPAVEGSPLDSIVVTRLPCLVGRYSSLFAALDERLSGNLSQISKKHAHLFLRNDAIHIEDLGSTNGTFVCGEKLSEHSRELVNGDTVAFGGEFFLYSVEVFVGQGTVIEAEKKIAGMAEGTVFVDDATNFFDIYMGAGDEPSDAKPDNTQNPDGTTIERAQRRRPSALGRWLRTMSEAFSSFGGGPVDRKLRWTVVVSVLVLAAGAGGYWYLTSPLRDVGALVEAGDYEAALQLAESHLGQRPNDASLRALATEASIRLYLPAWQEAIDNGAQAAALAVLARAGAASPGNPDDDALMDTLALATRLTGLDTDFAPVTTASALVGQWDERPNENARALSQIERHYGPLSDFQSDFYRKLRALREFAEDAAPFDGLTARIRTALEARNLDELRTTILAFAEENPDHESLPLLQDDLFRAEAVEQAVLDGRWLWAHRKLNEQPFRTAPFVDYAILMNASILPDDATRDAYRRADRAWRSGDAIGAFDILGELREQRWGSDADALLARHRRLLNQLVELQQNENAPDYADRLFALYGQLDPELDEFLKLALEPDFDRYRDAALDRASTRLDEARTAWQRYEAAGGIASEHRLDSSVSAEFRDRAASLSQAYRGLVESRSIYRQLDSPPPKSWSTLNASVVQEIKLQTQAIGDLLVIDGDVRRDKLDLLPAMSGS